jgi:hypothetical protein
VYPVLYPIISLKNTGSPLLLKEVILSCLEIDLPYSTLNEEIPVSINVGNNQTKTGTFIHIYHTTFWFGFITDFFVEVSSLTKDITDYHIFFDVNIQV